MDRPVHKGVNTVIFCILSLEEKAGSGRVLKQDFHYPQIMQSDMWWQLSEPWTLKLHQAMLFISTVDQRCDVKCGIYSEQPAKKWPNSAVLLKLLTDF